MQSNMLQWILIFNFSIAFIINCLLLVLGAALFYGVNTDQLGGFYDLYHALQNQPILGASMGQL